jgi:hypothetical protein
MRSPLSAAVGSVAIVLTTSSPTTKPMPHHPLRLMRRRPGGVVFYMHQDNAFVALYQAVTQMAQADGGSIDL